MKSLQQLVSFLSTFGVFTMLSNPSIKLFYKSELINLLSVCLLFAALAASYLGRGQKMVYLQKKEVGYLKIISFFLALIIFYGAISYSYISGKEFFRYILWYVILLLLIFNAKYVNLERLLWIMFLWGVLIAMLRLMGRMHVSKAEGQTYLTVGLPMGASLTIAIVGLMNGWFKAKKEKIFAGLLGFIVLSALLVSRGRSNILYPFLVVAFFVGGSILYNRNKRKVYLLLIVIATTVGLLFLQSFLNNSDYIVLQRLLRASESTGSEPRVLVWATTLDYIKTNPLGYGISYFNKFVTKHPYPHNLFLEVFFTFGILGFGWLSYVIIKYAKRMIATLRTNFDHKSIQVLGFLGLYFFFAWSTSFDFAISYIPLGCIILFCLFVEKEKANEAL